MPFLHITTHIEGRKDDGLFSSVGGRGFPSFFILDAKGEVVGQHEGERTADGFTQTVAKAQEFIDVRNKANAGDKVAKFKYALARAGMGKMTVDELKKEVKAAGKLSEADQAAYKGVLADLMVEEIQQTAVGERFAAMLKDGLVPADSQKQLGFYWSLFSYAEHVKDASLMGKALEGFKVAAGDNPRFAGNLDSLAKRLAKAKESK